MLVWVMLMSCVCADQRCLAADMLRAVVETAVDKFGAAVGCVHQGAEGPVQPTNSGVCVRMGRDSKQPADTAPREKRSVGSERLNEERERERERPCLR